MCTIVYMSKQVHIKDSTYNKLKELADAGYRSISAQIDMLLDDKPAPVVSAAPAAPEIAGYPCCSKATPCKHWIYNGADECWTNTLTGAIRGI